MITTQRTGRIPVRLSPRPVRALARRAVPALQIIAMRLLVAFGLAALTTLALLRGLDSIVLVVAALLAFAGMVRMTAEQATR